MKYKLTENKIKMDDTTLYQIQAIKDFGDVEKGSFGGWIEAEENLSQSGNAWVSGYARVYGNAWVYDNARVSQKQYIQNCCCRDDLSQNIKESIRCQTELGIFNEKIVAYKTVNKDMSSFKDEKFFYKVGEIAEVKNPEISNESCASGLHFSNMNYWDDKDGVFIQAEINLEDIITVQEGKIRCKKALITGMYER